MVELSTSFLVEHVFVAHSDTDFSATGYSPNPIYTPNQLGILRKRKRLLERIDSMMEPELHFELDGIPISSTTDGKVAVMDAIYAVTESDCPQTLWKRLTADHPEILNYCELHPFQDGKKRWVVGLEGWEKMVILLPEYLFDGC